MHKRKLGKTGAQLSMVGFGAIAVSQETPEYAANLVAQAVERGINYFDVAPTYGNVEERLGPALEPYRKDVFLACKTGKRAAAAAEEELHTSLKLLRTDHFDLYQLHAVTTSADVAQILARGGRWRRLLRPRKRAGCAFWVSPRTTRRRRLL